MKRQHKVVGFVASAAIAAMTLAGCSSGNGGPGDGGEESNEITVAAQAWMVEKFHMAEMVDKFEDANPGKTVKVVEYPDNQALSNFALQWSQNKSSQDIVVVDGASVAVQFLAKDLIIDFNKTDFFEGPTAKDKFVGETLKFDSLDGVQFAIPIGLETYNISANKTFFEEAGLLDANGDIPAPKDWNELYEMAKAMTVESGGSVTRPGMTIQWGPNAMSTMISVEQAVRGSFYKDDGKTLTFDTPEMREVLKIWKKGVSEGVFSIDTFANKDAGRSNFNAGNIPMVLETAAHVPEAAPTIGAENSVVLAMPGSMENGSYGFTAGIIVPSASKNQSLALKFIQEGMMSDVQVGVGLEWGKLPVIKEYFDQIDAPWKTAMYDLVKISQPAPMYRDLPEIQVTGKQMLQEYLTGAKDLDGFISELESLIDKANKEAQ
jgi:ABC-type glycerol-3-phosphate transport system substrate-binding protein